MRMQETRDRSAGFTMVELMIVVTIIGLLASVALPAFNKYVKKSRTVEAVAMIEKISMSAIVYYMAEHVGPDGATVDKQFPGSATVTTEATVCCPGLGGDDKFQCKGDSPVYRLSPWRELNFGIAEPHRYVPVAFASPDPKLDFWVYARGDLDCDGVRSEYHMKLKVVTGPSGPDVRRPGGLRIINDLE